ncbi:6-phosphogluconate dehydrogenase [Wenyingzhuangia sp. IMCC45533]
MKKFITVFLGLIVISVVLFFTIGYYLNFSEGYRSGRLVKISNKGIFFKTWEGEISQGVSDAQIFRFSVLDEEEVIIDKLKDLQGKAVKLTYKEKFVTMPWWGDTKYFVIDAEEVMDSNMNFY